MDTIDALLTRGVANIIPSKEELVKKLHSGEKLNIYLGIDPTTPHIHLGHVVPLRKLKTFVELGHHVTFLIGDFTAKIGDTSDKESERPALTEEEIKENFKTYKKQAEKILDFSKVTIHHNSEWLNKLSFADSIQLIRQFSLNDFLNRELIRKRLEENKHIGLHEMIYPVMQGYDSYYMDTDVQVGGTDQTFNMQAGRTLQKTERGKESFVLTLDFLMGTDGRKMSKSWGNAIWLDDKPSDMYAKVMAVNDDLLVQYYTLGTDIPLENIEKIKQELAKGENPMAIKKRLAFTIVEELYDAQQAQKAQEAFEKVVQKKELPEDYQIITLDQSFQTNRTVSDALYASGTVSSKAEAKRVIEQGGVSINSQKISDPNAPFGIFMDGGEAIIQKGKLTFRKIKIGSLSSSSSEERSDESRRNE